MEFLSWQKELIEILAKKGLSRNDILSVMMVLTTKERVEGMINALKERGEITPDEVFEIAGKIAFGENA